MHVPRNFHSKHPEWMQKPQKKRDVCLAMALLLGIACIVSLVLHVSSDSSRAIENRPDLPSWPLAVKSPYLSAWVPGNEITRAPIAQPQFWFGQPLTWSVLGRINGSVYTLFGMPEGVEDAKEATTNAVTYTSTHTRIGLTAGHVNITLDFFTPVFAGKDDYAKQSLPYSYLTINATSSGPDTQTVEIFSAIDHTWTAQHGAADTNLTGSGSASFFWYFNPTSIDYTEVDDMATYGSVLFATTADAAVSAGCGPPSTILTRFAMHGSLPGVSTCTGTDLTAFSRSLGDVKATAGSVTFAIGLERVNAVNYMGKSQTGFHRTQWPTPREAVPYFLSNYDTALSTSLAFDSSVRRKAESVSSAFGRRYADIIEASVRQTFGALELTTPKAALDDASDPIPSAFLKEISSDGNVNTVDLIYQSWPIFISLNPEYIKLLFRPILDYLKIGAWPHPWTVHDIGTHYPNATGHNLGNDESMPLFETSALFILLLAYQSYTNDTSFAQLYSSLLEGYARYLAEHSLYPAKQLSSVDAIGATANQTALAVQATIGLKAASIIKDNSTYAEIADLFANTIYGHAVGLDGATLAESTHFTYNYGDDESWNVLFASYSDVILNLSTFPASAWEMQSGWYTSQMQEGGLPFAGPATDLHYTGEPLNWGLTDWNVVAASVSSTAVQQAVIDTTWTFMTNGQNAIPFGTKYIVRGQDVGKWTGNKARSSVGSHFALLALQQGFWEDLYP